MQHFEGWKKGKTVIYFWIFEHPRAAANSSLKLSALSMFIKMSRCNSKWDTEAAEATFIRCKARVYFTPEDL